MNYWILKSEPETYSFDDLLKDGKTKWNGVRNHQAKNFLKQMKVGDICMIYHSGDCKEIVGTAKVSKEAYPDLDPKKPGDWVQVDITPEKKLQRSVSLSEMRSEKALKDLLLFRQSRLSVIPFPNAAAKDFLKQHI